MLLMVVLIAFGCSEKKDKPSASGTTTVTKTVGIKVPDVIKGKWKAVRIAVYDKSSMQETLYDINIGSTLSLPNSDVTIEVNNFFPHYVLKGIDQTSESNKMINPAVQLTVRQGATVIVKGWLYGNYPTLNDKMNNNRVAMSFVDAIPNK
jgi:hypothetical protein